VFNVEINEMLGAQRIRPAQTAGQDAARRSAGDQVEDLLGSLAAQKLAQH
jgi:hypothetical protein